MPAAYEGGQFTTTNGVSPTTAPWASLSAAFTTGTYCQPSPATGQYFQATVGGTTSSTQPSWSTASALPVPGTTFIDGSVTWTCMGSILTGIQSIVIDLPVDTDPAVTAIIVRALKDLANYAADAGYLGASQTWTQRQFIAPASGIALTATAGTGNTAGITAFGSGSGPGVSGTGGSSSGPGLFGLAGGGGAAGVQGSGAASNGPGLSGTGGGSQPGVLGQGGASGNGVSGTAGATTGYGVFGQGSSGSSTGYGVYGIGGSSSPGVQGLGGSGGEIGTTGVGTGGFPGIYGTGSNGGLGATGNGPGAKFDSSTNRGAISLPGQASDPTLPQAGDIYYNSSTNHLKYYNGSAWVIL
jgi:hypothetical protein